MLEVQVYVHAHGTFGERANPIQDGNKKEGSSPNMMTNESLKCTEGLEGQAGK